MRLLLFLLMIFTIPRCLPNDWSGDVGLYEAVTKSDAEYGQGLVFIAEIEYSLTERFSVSWVHKSYVFEGEPFGEPEDSESAGDFIGVKYKLF